MHVCNIIPCHLATRNRTIDVTIPSIAVLSVTAVGNLCLCTSVVRTQSPKYAFDWYEKALHYMDEDEDGGFDATMDSPPYIIKAKMAELLLAGGAGLEKNPLRSGE